MILSEQTGPAGTLNPGALNDTPFVFLAMAGILGQSQNSKPIL
jgi:hypothetical protein